MHAGEVLCLLGPNGAGKTTTFRMLAALLLPTRGEVMVAGTPLTPDTADQVRSRVGLLTEAPGLWERLTVRANLLTYARLHGVADEGRRVTAVMQDVGIDDRADERAGALSKGLKQRVAIARALVHDPPVVLLDEPTSGLDPASARHVRDLIGRLRADGRAVLVSTHNLAEAEELADRIAILNTRLIACDTPRRLREQRRGGRLVIDVEGDAAVWPRGGRRAPARSCVSADGTPPGVAAGGVARGPGPGGGAGLGGRARFPRRAARRLARRRLPRAGAGRCLAAGAASGDRPQGRGRDRASAGPDPARRWRWCWASACPRSCCS